MIIKTAIVNLVCAECGKIIKAGTRYAQKQISVKNLFNIPAEMSATSFQEIHLSHVYSDAQEKINKRFCQLDIFEAQK